MERRGENEVLARARAAGTTGSVAETLLPVAEVTVCMGRRPRLRWILAGGRGESVGETDGGDEG